MKQYAKSFFFFILAYVAIGCVGTKHLKEGEYLLYNQKINFSNDGISDNLYKQLAQKHNSRIWFLPVSPYTYLYYQGLKTYDTAKYELKKSSIHTKYESKIASASKPSEEKKYKKRLTKKEGKIERKINDGNILMRWGEPLTIFDSAYVHKSTRNLSIYMKSNGWFMAKVDYKVNFENKLTRVNYNIKPGPQYIIDTIFYDIADSAIAKIVSKEKTKSLVEAGQPYRQSTLSNERDRIDALLKNNGYFDFTKQYIRYRVDSTKGDKKVSIQLQILNPEKGRIHKSFVIDSVSFAVDESNTHKAKKHRNFVYKGVNYSFFDRYYSEKVLSRRIHLKPGDPYSKQNTLNTQLELAGMDMFKFVNVNYDSTGNHFQASIFVSPLHRYQWTAEVGLTVTQSLPGPFASISLKQRNVFKTLGILELGGNIGVDGVAAASNPNDVLASLEAGANASLTFPRFFLPMSDETKMKLGFYNPKSTLFGGLSFTDRPEYKRSNINFYNSYSWQPKQNILYDFRFLEVARTRTDQLDSAYYERLLDLEKNGNNLINSFRPSFLSNQRFTRSVNTNNYGRAHNNSSYFSLAVEPGGTFTNLWARDYFAKDSVEIYAYVKIDTDYRKILASGDSKSWAFRIRSGIAVPYGPNGLLPYEKYFFSGGSISNRAWKPRRLGPGSYDHIEEDGQVSYKFEQQGEIIIESNVEFRQKLIGMLNWAAFVDAGNIWTIKEDNARPGSQFKFDRFYREIAVGFGLGLRFDFSFFVMRFDASTKVVDPARPIGKRFIFSSGFNDAPFDNPKYTEPIVYTISIGYPF